MKNPKEATLLVEEAEHSNENDRVVKGRML